MKELTTPVTAVEKSVDVKVPVRTAYNQWTQFESFPSFMTGVEEIRQVTPTRTHWVTRIGGVTREFDTEITEQHPDERVAWRSVDRPTHGGVVTFHRLSNDTTRVNLQMEYHPDTVAEKVGTVIGSVQRRIEGDLERFKKFIETRGQETGAWRGDVSAPPQSGTSAQPQSGTFPQSGTSAQSGTFPQSGTSTQRESGASSPRHDQTGGIADPDEPRAPRGGTSGSSIPPTSPGRSGR
jgi:hypothetical protein